jgi:hypothetical protein
MFTAFIMICSISFADGCMELEDDRGPYEVRSVCKERVDEMVYSMLPVIPPGSEIKWKCVHNPIQNPGVNT